MAWRTWACRSSSEPWANSRGISTVTSASTPPVTEVRLFTEDEIAALERTLMARIADTAKRTCPRPVVREPGVDGPAAPDLLVLVEPPPPVATCLEGFRGATPPFVARGVFPAHAGMNRIINTGIFRGRSVPRPRGDEPPYNGAATTTVMCSPPTRG